MSLTDEKVLCMIVHLGDYYYTEKGIIQAKENDDTPVICKVPSYEEFLILKSEIDELKHFSVKNVCLENEVLTLENAELKSKIKHFKDLQANQDKEVESLRDLLKECKNYLKNSYPAVTFFNERKNLLRNINAAIGERADK